MVRATRKLIGIILAAALVIGLMPAFSLQAKAAYPALENVSIDEYGMMTWDAFPGAARYYFTLSGEGNSGGGYIYDNQYDLDATCVAWGLRNGTCYVSLYAENEKGDQLSQEWGGTYYFSHAQDPLDTPSNVRWSGNTVTWDPVPNAEQYFLQIRGEGLSRQFWKANCSQDLTNYLNVGTQQYTIYITAYAEGFPGSDPYSEVRTLTVTRDPLTNVTLTDGILSWNAFPGAGTYDITISGEGNAGSVYSDETSFNLADYCNSYGFSDGTYDITLVAMDTRGGGVISAEWYGTFTYEAAAITVQPTNEPGIVGDIVYFTLDAKGIASYQWQYSRDGERWFNSGASGNDTDTVRVRLTDSNINHQWRCYLVGCDGTEIISDIVHAYAAPPEINLDPVDQVGRIGESVQFEVEAQNAVSYCWQYSTDGTTFKNTKFDGYKTNKLTVPVNSAGYYRYYWRCIVVGQDGTGLSSHYARILPPPAVIYAQPVNVEAAVGETVNFYVTAGDVKSYQWQYSTDNATWKSTKLEGYNTSALAVTVNSNGYFNYYWRCLVTGLDGVPVPTNSAQIIKKVSAKITTQPQNVSAYVGDVVHYHVEATNAVSYQWQYSTDKETWKNTKFDGYDTDTLNVFMMSDGRFRNYFRCLVTGPDGVPVASKAAHATQLFWPVVFYAQPQNVSASVGDTVEFEVTADNAYSYQWQYSTDGDTWKNTKLPGYDTDTLSVELKTTGWFRYYWRCLVSDGAGITYASDMAEAFDQDKYYTVILSINKPGCTVEYNGVRYSNGEPLEFTAGTEVYLYAQAGDGYVFDEFWSEDVRFSWGGSICRHFTMPKKDITVYVFFDQE